MSKKKAINRSTMTLKDFHGGSIPSDLPLPSAPGISVRPFSDHRQLPQQNAWDRGNMHQRLRPESAGYNNNSGNNSVNVNQRYGNSGSGGGGGYGNERSNIYMSGNNIGQNFDEDERKPLDGSSSMPRRTVSDESRSVSRQGPGRNETVVPLVKNESLYNSVGGVGGGVGKVSEREVRSPPSRFSGSRGGNSGGGTGGVPNAWGTRKEPVTVSEVVPVAEKWSVSRFAQASAIEKVSSGRWQSKNVGYHNHLPEVEVIGYTDDVEKRGFDGGGSGRDERSGFDYEKRRSPGYQDQKDRHFSRNVDSRVVSQEGRTSGMQMKAPVETEVAGNRPKLKLLPRSKPLEASESPYEDDKQVHEVPAGVSHVDSILETHGKDNLLKPVPVGGDDANRVVERPKLNLKPRTQPFEQRAAVVVKEWNALFGSARPREMVLMERGVNDVTINNLEPVQSPNRNTKIDAKRESVARTPRHGDRVDNLIVDQRSRKDFEKKDNRADADGQRSSWRSDSWKNNNRDSDKHPQQQQEKRPEPETWRKSIEELKPTLPDAQGLRFGKAATALELAQAFSRSVSDVRAPGRNQVPFSRLTDDTWEIYSGSSSRHHINSY